MGESFSLDAVLDCFAGDYDLFVEVAEIYLSACEEVFSGMKEALTQGDMATLAGLAHKFSGSVSIFAVAELTELAQQLEELAISRNALQSQKVFRDLEVQVAILNEAMREVIEQRRSA